MELNKLNFEISKNSILTDEEKEFLTEAYRKLYIKIYGYDLFDSFAFVTKTSTDEIINQNENIQNIAENYIRAKEIIESLTEEDIVLLLIYFNDNLIGGGRLKEFDSSIIYVLDIAIDGVSKDVEREIWKKAISFIENYFTNQKFKKMYIEIPLKEGPLLIRAGELGFVENPNDINDERPTYLLNKPLEVKDDK